MHVLRLGTPEFAALIYVRKVVTEPYLNSPPKLKHKHGA